ncbi:hypothetical protein ACFLSS_03885 [Bacteroidota bacterium]
MYDLRLDIRLQLVFRKYIIFWGREPNKRIAVFVVKSSLLDYSFLLIKTFFYTIVEHHIMAKNYKQIIDDLEKAIKGIASQGISIEPLNNALEELKSHSENIAAVEENIDAVKLEVINPIKTELNQNKKAGKFSIWGFYLGAFGIVVTAISLLYSTFNETYYPNLPDNELGIKIYNIEKSLNELNYTIKELDEDYKPLSSEFLLGQFESSVFLEQDTNKLIIKAYIPKESEIDNKWFPFVSLSFFVNDKQFGIKGIKEKIQIENLSGVAYYKDDWSSIWLSENDEFVFMNKYKFKVKRIYRTESHILTICDSKDGVLIHRIE